MMTFKQYQYLTEESGVKTKEISFDEWWNLVNKDKSEFTLFQEDLKKNGEADIKKYWKDRKFIGYFRDDEFIGYLIYGYNFLNFDKEGKMTKGENEINTLHLFTSELKSSERGKGTGTELFKKFFDVHKGEKMTLQAHTDKLISYYNKFGFKETGSDGNAMRNF